MGGRAADACGTNQAQYINAQHGLPVIGSQQLLATQVDGSAGVAALLMQQTLKNAGKVCRVLEVSNTYWKCCFALYEWARKSWMGQRISVVAIQQKGIAEALFGSRRGIWVVQQVLQ